MTKDITLEKLGKLQKVFHGHEYALVISKDADLNGYLVGRAKTNKIVWLADIIKYGLNGTRIAYLDSGDTLTMFGRQKDGSAKVKAHSVRKGVLKYLGELK